MAVDKTLTREQARENTYTLIAEGIKDELAELNQLVKAAIEKREFSIVVSALSTHGRQYIQNYLEYDVREAFPKGFRIYWG